MSYKTRRVDPYLNDKILEKKITNSYRKYRKIVASSAANKTKKEKSGRDLNPKKLDELLDSTKKEYEDIMTTLKVACGTEHVEEDNKNMNEVKKNLDLQDKIQEEMETTKSQIADLKGQILRSDKQLFQMIKKVECDDDYEERLRRVRRELESNEKKVEIARQKQGLLVMENRQKLQMIENLLYDRTIFNKYWKSKVKRLHFGKKHLIHMIEKLKIDCHEGEIMSKKLKQLKNQRAQNKTEMVGNMLDIMRQIDAATVNNQFLRDKAKRRQLCEIDPREVHRRQNCVDKNNEQLSIYRSLIDDLANRAGIEKYEDFKNREINKDPAQKGRLAKLFGAKSVDEYPLEKTEKDEDAEFQKELNFLQKYFEHFDKNALKTYIKQENEYFQYFDFINHLNSQIEYLTISTNRMKNENTEEAEIIHRNNNFNKERIKLLNNELEQEVDKTLDKKVELEKYEKEIEEYLDGVKEILEVFECDTSHLEKKLGDYKNVTMSNLAEFLSVLESTANNVLAFIFCDERQGNLKLSDEKFVVRGKSRKVEPPVTIQDVAQYEPCPECAESEEVDYYDKRIVYPLSREEVKEKLKEQVKKGIQMRLHNLSACALPKSVALVNKRYL